MAAKPIRNTSLLEIECDYILLGGNCFHKNNEKTYKDFFYASTTYREHIKKNIKGDWRLLGTADVCEFGDKKIVTCYGVYDLDNVTSPSTKYLESALHQAREIIPVGSKIASHMMYSNLRGFGWKAVRRLLDSIFADDAVFVVVQDGQSFYGKIL